MKKSNLVKVLLGLTLSLIFLCGCNQKKDVVDFKQLGDKMLKAFNAHDASALTEFYADDAVLFDVKGEELARGKAAIEKYYTAYFRAFPDLKMDFVQIIAAGDQVCYEFINRGTFTGPFAGPQGDIQPTGLKSVIKGAFLAKLTSAGLIKEDRSYYDELSWMKQLGLIKQNEEK